MITDDEHMPEVVEIELTTLEKKPHWFLDRLRLMDVITVSFVTLWLFISLYMRINVYISVSILLAYVGTYFYLIRYSKNYFESGKIKLAPSKIHLQNDSGISEYDWGPAKPVRIEYVSYKGTPQWLFKQVNRNKISFAAEDSKIKVSFQILNKNEMNVFEKMVKEMSENYEGFKRTNTAGKRLVRGKKKADS